MIFVEKRSGQDRRQVDTKFLEPDKEKRRAPVGRRLIDRLQKVKIDPNDLIIFRIPSMTEAVKNNVRDISNFVRNKDAFVVFTFPNIEVEKFPEDLMNKMGWYRKENESQ